jgi:peroxiredoxin
VIAISTDDRKTVGEFARALGASYPMLADETREVSKAYGVLDPGGRVARRVTFVIDRKGVVRKIDSGSDALDPGRVVNFCSLLDHK